MRRYVNYKNQKQDIDNLRNWSKEKERIYRSKHSPYFRERDVWWASIGFNIGDEQNGKNIYFERPVLIVKRFYNHLFLGLPLSTVVKKGNYYFRIVGEKVDGVIILSQGRVIDAKRLIRKIETLDEKVYKNVVEKYKELI